MKKFNYGWLVCLMGMIMVLINIGAVANGFSVFLPYVIEEQGFTYTQGSNLITMRCLFSFIAMFCVHRYFNLFSLRTGSAVATFLACAGYGIYAIADNYMLYCIGAALGGFAFSFGSMVGISMLMQNWFPQNTVTAIAICAAGSGIGTIILPPISTMLIEEMSLKAAFGIESVAFFVCSALIFLVMRDGPAEEVKTDLKEARAEVTANNKSRNRNIKPVWIYVTIASVIIGMLGNTGVTHLAALYTANGYEAMTVAYFVSISGIVLTVGKVLCGSMTDRIGGFKTSIIFGLILMTGHVLCVLAFTESIAIGMVGAFIIGLGWPIGTLGPSIWAGDLVNPEHYGRAVQVFQTGYAGGALAFAGLPGLMADHTGGTYNSSYALMGFMAVIFMVFVIVSYRTDSLKKLKD